MNLFEQENPVSTTALPDGLLYLPDFVSPQEQQTLLQHIDQATWLGDLKRRVQHYGFKYDYQARKIDKSLYLGALPDWSQWLVERIMQQQWFKTLPPDQLIVNEYQAGQGISAHIDCVPCFSDTIVSVTLGSACVMDFVHVQNKQKISVFLASGSAVALTGESRYQWTHSIAARKKDVFNGVSLLRTRRVSLTFRKVLLE